MKSLLAVLVLALLTLTSSAQYPSFAKKHKLLARSPYDVKALQGEYKNEFQNYVNESKTELHNNSSALTWLNYENKWSDPKSLKKNARKIYSLIKENKELEAELTEFQLYGEGSWLAFKQEFSKDLFALRQDIQQMWIKFEDVGMMLEASR